MERVLGVEAGAPNALDAILEVRSLAAVNMALRRLRQIRKNWHWRKDRVNARLSQGLSFRRTCDDQGLAGRGVCLSFEVGDEGR